MKKSITAIVIFTIALLSCAAFADNSGMKKQTSANKSPDKYSVANEKKNISLIEKAAEQGDLTAHII